MSFKSFISQLLKTARDQVFKLDDQAIRYGIQFADLTLTTFENQIETKIGFDLPIPWTLEDLFADKIVNLSNKAQDIIAERVAAKLDERNERRAERLALETQRSARHLARVAEIKTAYREELKRIDELTDRTTFSTVIKFTPPPEVTEVVILGQLRTVEEQVKPYSKEFRGDLIQNIDGLDFREFVNQGATETDIKYLNSGNFSSRLKTKKKGLDRIISFEEENRLRRNALYKYQAEILEENDIYADERARFRQEDRDQVDLEKQERDRQRTIEKRDKYNARLNRQRENKIERDKAKEARDDRREEEEKRKLRERRDKSNNKLREKRDKENLRQDQIQRLDEAKNDRNLAEAEFDRDIEQAIEELDLQVELGNITEAQKREILRDIRDEEKVDVNNAKGKIREVRAGIRQENKAARQAKRASRDPKIKFDTSKLKDPEFVRSVYLQTYQFLPQQNKDELAVNLATYQRGLNTTVKSLSIIQGVIGSVRTILSSLAGTGNTLTIVSDSVKVATNLITTLPIPTGAPIGVGLPLNVITSLSQTLDELIQQNEKVNGAAELISEATPPINEKLEDTLDVINTILDVITIVLDLVVFLNYVAQSGANSIDGIRNEIGAELNNALEQSGNSSNQGQNVDEQEDLLSRLNPNSNNPLFYKGFRLTLQYVQNEGELTQTRVLGVNPTNGVSLATDLSFTTSPEVLVQEIQFKIDNYNLIFVNDPNVPVFDQLDNLDIEGLLPDVVIPETDLDLDIESPERLTKKQIRERKRKDRRSDRKERKEARQAGEITRKEARKDRKQDRKERKKEAKDRRRNRIRKKER
jgi:hypothetical protein